MGQSFSNLVRQDIVQDLQTQTFDLLIIGGGVTGAGILLDATARGIRAALIEMQDFAAGTSSRSTKLVHGGLRYLKQFEIGLVAEVGKERAIVYENAPHVTTPEWMLLPIIQGGTYGRLTSSIGIRLYDFLAGVKKHERRKMLNVEQTLAKEPLLRTEGLKGSGYYVEYKTDDARLTLEIIKEAVDRGALALNYTQAVNFLYEEEKMTGVHVHDAVTDMHFDVYARQIVNATGPWVDSLREIDGSKRGKTLHHTKGVHIVVDANRFPLHNAVYFDVPDGRMIFAIPRADKVYIGTTDTDFSGDFLHPRVTRADMDYLVDSVNFMFPTVALTSRDVESSWAGIRPLIHEEGKGPSEISRRDEVFRAQSGLLTIAGGKLTGYRKMAEKVVNLVADELSTAVNRTFPPCPTLDIKLSGGHVGGAQGFPAFVEEHVTEGRALGLDEKAARRLVQRYGSNVDTIYEIIRERGEEAAQFELSAEVFATLVYAIDYEMIYKPEDFFTRRTSATFFDIAWVHQWKQPVIQYMATQFGWTPETVDMYSNELEQRLEEATVVI